MSADNGVYILHTKDGYRVNHCQAIDNIYWWHTCCEKPDVIYMNEDDISYCEKCLNCGTINPDFEQRDEICSERLLEYFGDCEVFKTKKEAITYSIKLHADIVSDDFCPICEYGIIEINAEHIDLGDNNEQ